jgi:hemoglobin
MAKQKQITESERGGDKAALVEKKLSLYERLGEEKGITAIVEDFTQRALQDPRVNWQRQGIKRGGLFGGKKADWQSTPENVAVLNKHMVQFLSLATGGPAEYQGKGIKAGHADMKITNPEFDAAIGDLKASLDRLQIADREQKELLAIVESTRPQIVTER